MSDPRRRRCLSTILLILGSWVAHAAAKQDIGEALKSPHAPGELIIRFQLDAPTPARLSLLTRWNATSQRRFASGAEHWVLRDPASLERALRELSSSPLVAFVEPNYRRSVELAPNDPYYPNLYGLKNTGQTGGYSGADIDAELAWDVTTGNRSVLIAVSDTGVDRAHPDLAANVWTNPLEVPGNSVDDDQNGYIDDVHGWDFVYNDNDPSDFHSHGTHVAGTIGAVGNNGIGVVGVNWNVSIVPVKILSDDGYGYDASIIAGIDYATQIGVTAINASWGGGGYSTGIMEAIRRAGDAGVLFIAAAGNYSSNNDYYAFYPATYDLPNIVAVAATNHNDQLAYFSNYGAATVDLGAPGTDTYSTLPSSNYGYKSGTSMAAPHVAGVAALIKSLAPDITMTGLRAQLLDYVDQIPALSGITVTGGRLDARAALGAADELPPSPIVDLLVENPSSNTVMLTWAAPGGNGTTGRAASYELRYSLTLIDDTSFGAATLAPDTPRPSAYGSNERFEVLGLSQSTTYYFAIRSRDEWGNQSALSNVVSATTLGPPTLVSSPDSFTVDVLTGETTQRVLTIQNAGAGSLDWQASITTPGATESAPQEPLDLAKGEVDPRKGPPAIQRRGGPDGFGYRYIDSDDPTGPAFSWNDISATGQAIADLTGDDQVSEPIPIGFLFRFYGVDFEQVRVSTNGFLSFTSNSTAFTNQPLPSPAAPEYLVAPLWDDLSFDSASRAWYLSDGHQFTVQYSAVRGSDGTSLYTFQVSLHADGAITFRYLTLGGTTAGATIGIQDGTRLIALPIAFNTSYVRDSFAVEIAAAIHWLSVQPLSGRAWTGESTEATLTFDARQLDGGTYDSSLLVTSNDPLQPLKNHPVRLNVNGAPDLRILGAEQRVVSTQLYAQSGASTTHHLAIDPAAANGGMLLLTAAGDYGNDTEQATVIVEGESLGSTAPMGVDCAPAQRSFPLSDVVLQRWASDSVVDVQVSNSLPVDAFCATSRHELKLSYRLAVDRLDFEPTYILGSRSLTVELRNVGTDPLVISSIQTNSSDFVPSSPSLTLAPRQRALLAIDFRPTVSGTREAQLTLESNDPDTPVFTLSLSGVGSTPPDVAVAPLQFQFDLLSGASETRALQLDNLGGDRLNATLLVAPPTGTGMMVSRFQGLSRNDTQAANNGESSQVGSGAAETPFTPADRVFKKLNTSPYALTCVAADPLASAIYAQRFAGASFHRYSAAEGVWQELAPSPLASGLHGGAAVLNGKIYTSYADNGLSVGVYDIATDSWTTIPQPLGNATANITSDGISTLYFSYGSLFRSYDPSTGQTRQLAAPPFWIERLAALVYRNGVIFGLQGNGYTGFAKYLVSEDRWIALSPLPAGATLGAAFDESRKELVAIGPSGGRNYYSFNVASGQWSVSSIPYFTVYPGGLAFLPNLGVYFAQGEFGTGFALAVPDIRWLSALPSIAALDPQQSASVSVSADALDLYAGVYQAEIRIESNDPDEAVISIPVTLSVTGAPDILVLGQERVDTSLRSYTIYQATTDHHFAVGPPPFASGELVIEVNGDFGYVSELAIVRLEGTEVGRIGAAGVDCTVARGILPIDPQLLEQVTQDGVVSVSLTNTADVDLFCQPNQHSVQLRTRKPASSISFGSLFIGSQATRSLQIVNQGTDALSISALILTGDAFRVGMTAPTQIPAGQSAMLDIFLAPTIAGSIEETLTIVSNDADQPRVDIALSGISLVAPVIEVEPLSLTADLYSGETLDLPVLIRNLGGSELTFGTSVGSPLGPNVVERSSEFTREPSQQTTEDPSALPTPVDPADLFTFAARENLAASSVSATAEQPLERWLTNLSARFEEVTSLIPNRFNFSEGDTGFLIGDGGGDMYDGGNYLSLGAGYLPYTAGQIQPYTDLSGAGRYFTKKLSGLFVFAADINGAQEFSVSGDLGADGYGSVDGSVLSVTSGGQRYLGFVKRVFNTGDPSVNHLVIVRDRPGITHEFSTYSNSDYQRVFNLGETRRVYFLLMASTSGGYIDDARMLGIMKAFLSLTTPPWLSVAPDSGSVPAGGTAELMATINTAGMLGGEYASEIVVTSNDPIVPVVSVPTSLRVTGVPHLSVKNAGLSQSSVKNFFSDGASTYHTFTLEPLVVPSAASLRVMVQGDFGDTGETATVHLEGTQIGELGASASDCAQTTLAAALDPQLVRTASQDGELEFVVANSASVGANCTTNQHSLSLTLDADPEQLDFGSVFIGQQLTRSLMLENTGSDRLVVSSIEPSDATISVSPSSLPLEPGTESTISVTFAPTEPRIIDGTIAFLSNDPRQPTLSFPVRGTATAPPQLEFKPAELSVSVPALGAEERPIRITNRGGSDLLVRVASSFTGSSSNSGQAALATGPASYRPQEPPEGPGTPTPSTGGEQRQEPLLSSTGFDFYDGFEDQSLSPWNTRSFPTSITSETAAAGSNFSVRIDGGSNTHYTGAYVSFAPAQPSYVGFWIRTSSNTSHTAYFVLRDNAGLEPIFFYARGSGRFYINGDVGGDESVPYAPDTWYHIEYKNIDFTTKQFDYYVDGALIRPAIPMRYGYMVNSFQSAEIYNYSARSSWWDEVVIGDHPRPEWLQFRPDRLSIPPGQYADLTARLDATNLAEGDFNGNLLLTTNDPANRAATIPVSMRVIGVPDIALRGDNAERTSSSPHYGRGSSTAHPFDFDEIPASDVVVTVAVNGDFSGSSEYATVAIDGMALGRVGGVGPDCETIRAEFVIGATRFAELISDGIAEVTVVNSGDVDSFCPNPLHSVTLQYRRPVSIIQLGRLFTGGAKSAWFMLGNLGVEPLTVSSLRAGSGEIAITPSSLTLPPRSEQQIQVTFAPLIAGLLQDTLTIDSDDPDEPRLTVTLQGEGIAPPQIHLSHTALHATVLPDDVISLPVDIANAGGSGLLIDSKAPVPIEPLADDAAVAEPLKRNPDPVLDDLGVLSDIDTPVPTELQMAGAKVLLIEDRYPYFSRANEDALTAAGLAYDRIQSASLATWPLASYRLLIVAGDQTTSFYQTLTNSMPRLEAWVSIGGTLQFHLASWGLAFGDPSVVVLPGGVTTQFEYADKNRVSLPGHRFMVDVPLEFTGYPASTALIAGAPPSAELVCVNEWGSPTLVVYSHGLGDVVVSTQTLERAYASYYPHRPILENLIKSGAGGLIRWLHFAPARAIVAAGQTLPATTTLSAIGLPPDRYEQSLTISSNDPHQPTSTIDVQLDVVRLLAHAGSPQQLECEGHEVATAQLQATASRHMDGFNAIERFEWFEQGASIAQGSTVQVPLAVGGHELQLAIFDAISDTSVDSVHLDVLDTLPPSGAFTYPAPAQCLGPGALPVTVRDNFTDVCSGADLSRSYDRSGGAVFDSHGDQSVSMTVRDPYGNVAPPVSLAFTIDTKPPVTKILFDPSRWTFPRMIPFQTTFSSHDNDAATGLVVRERVLVDGCVFYDGNAYGDNDGLLLDETLPAMEDELCRLKRLCQRTTWKDPVITVEATDCAGNVSTSRKTKPGGYNANRCP